MLRIRQAKTLINGRHPDGSKATFAPDVKYVRYAIVLLAALTLSNFEYYTKKIQKTSFISYYDLFRVARVLGLEFERTKSAPYVYKKLIDLRQIKLIVMKNRTYVTFTNRGKKGCEEKLEELQLINELFNTNPSARVKYKQKEDWNRLPAKGTRSQSSQALLVETKIDKLIKKLSQW